MWCWWWWCNHDGIGISSSSSSSSFISISSCAYAVYDFLFSHYHHHWTVLCPKREEGYANFCGSSSHSSSRRRRNIDCTHIAHHGRRRVPTMLLRTKRRDQLPANIAAVGGGCCGCGEGGDGSCGDDHAPTKMLPMNMWHTDEWMLFYYHDFIWNPTAGWTECISSCSDNDVANHSATHKRKIIIISITTTLLYTLLLILITEILLHIGLWSALSLRILSSPLLISLDHLNTLFKVNQLNSSELSLFVSIWWSSFIVFQPHSSL